MPVSLERAQAVIEKAHAKASQVGIKVTVAIVDEGGYLVALGRMDGAIPLSPQLAEAKAVGAAMFGRDGEALAKMAQDRPGFFAAADRLVRTPLIPGLGSALIAEDGRLIGAVGVSGGRPDQDLECAVAGLAEL
jgi:uncharacterized protein GlcG (DUF336 family)